MFEEYYQVGNPERDQTKGLGLRSCDASAASLNCLQLRAQAALRASEGALCFLEFTLPLAEGAPIAAEPEPSPREPKRRARARAFIVVVDDEQAIRQATASLLTGWGFHVVAAASGDEAVERPLHAAAAPPNLIICDYRLRGEENGLGAIERLRSEFNQSIPAMLITGDTAAAGPLGGSAGERPSTPPPSRSPTAS